MAFINISTPNDLRSIYDHTIYLGQVLVELGAIYAKWPQVYLPTMAKVAQRYTGADAKQVFHTDNIFPHALCVTMGTDLKFPTHINTVTQDWWSGSEFSKVNSLLYQGFHALSVDLPYPPHN